MGSIPPELTSSALTALALLGGWFATWLARKGKREDTRIAESNQSWAELKDLSDARLAEINRLSSALAAQVVENDRVRKAWEARWDKQMARCRKATSSLVRAVTALRRLAGPAAEAEAAEVLRVLEAHNEDDHQ